MHEEDEVVEHEDKVREGVDDDDDDDVRVRVVDGEDGSGMLFCNIDRKHFAFSR